MAMSTGSSLQVFQVSRTTNDQKNSRNVFHGEILSTNKRKTRGNVSGFPNDEHLMSGAATQYPRGEAPTGGEGFHNSAWKLSFGTSRE